MSDPRVRLPASQPVPMDEHRLRYLFGVLSYLQDSNIRLSELIAAVLVHKQFNQPNDLLLQDLVHKCQDILSAFYDHPATAAPTSEWAHDRITKRYTTAVRNLADVDQGWHFGVMHATPDQVRDFRLEDMAASMRRSEPELWNLVFSLLGGQGSLTDQSGHQEVEDAEEAQYWIDDEDVEQMLSSAGRADGRGGKGRRDRAGLIQIKSVVVLSIFMHAMDQQCNALQSTMGIFLHSCNAPEKLAKVLSRMGISTSLSSTHRAIISLSQQSHDDIRALGRTLLTSHAFDNFDAQIKTLISTIDKQRDGLLHLTSGTLLRLVHATLDDLRCSDILWDRSELNIHATDPRPFDPRATMVKLCSLHPEPEATLQPSGLTRRGRFRAWFFTRTLLEHGPPSLKSLLSFLPSPEFVDPIPLSKLYQTPLRAMNINQSTVSGNIEAILNIFEQAGLGNPFDSGSDSSSMQVDPTEFAILVHGDLGTCERVLSGLRRRSQEQNPYDRLQSVVFIPGLFHLKMAAADAIWRALVSPKGAREDDTSFMKLAGELRPNESSRLVNNAKFRQQHELISHVGVLLQLDAWRVEIKKRFGYTTLDEWAATKPTLADIQEVAVALALHYVEGEDVDLYMEARRSEADRDRIQENTMRTLNYLFLYEELSYAMNAGDIGRVETLFPPWIQLFRATGKHKYSHQLLRFAHALYFVYPEGLRKVIRYNILVNPTGKAMEFRAVDWVVELLNLYIKVIYGGEGSNYTKNRIFLESVIVLLLRSSHANFERNFRLPGLTYAHARKDMRATFRAMLEKLVIRKPNEHCGRGGSGYCIADALTEGATILAKEWSRPRDQAGQVVTREGEDEMDEDLGEGDDLDAVRELTEDDLGVEGML